MATQIGGTIVWNLDVDDGKFQSGLNRAKSQAASFSKDVDKEFKGLQHSVSNSLEKATAASQVFAGTLVAIGTGLVAAAGFGIKYAANLETMTQGFITLLGSAEKANEAIAMIQKDAAQTPFEFKGLVNANFMLTSVTKNAQQSERLLLNIGKALTASGKSGAELDRIIVNLQQIANVGKITELDIRQFGFAGINILELLADYYGTTKDAANDMIKNSKDAFKDLEGAFVKAGEGGGRFARAFIDQAGTMNQLWSNFRDNLGITASQIVKQTGLFDGVKNALKKLVGVLGYFASPEGTAKIVEFFSAIRENAPIVIGIILGGLAPALWALAAPIIASTVHLLPFIAAGLALGFAAQFIIKEMGGWEAVMGKLSGAFQALGDAYNTYLKPGIDSLIKEIKTNLLPALQELWTELKPVLIPVFQLLGKIIAGAVIVYLRYLVEQMRAVVAVVTTVARAISNVIQFFKSLISYFKDLNESGDYLNDSLSEIPKAFRPVISTIGIVINLFKYLREAFKTGDFLNDWITHLPPAMENAFKSVIRFIDFVKTIPGQVMTTLNEVGTALAAIPGKVASFFQALPGMIGNALIAAGLKFVEFLGFVTGLVIYGIPILVENIVTFFRELPGKIAEVFTNVYNTVSLWITNTSNWLAVNIPLMIDSVVAFFTALPGRIMSALTMVLTVVIGGFVAIWNWLRTTVPQIIETVINFFATLPERIGAWLNTTRDRTSTGFKDIWSAVINEISTWPARLYEWGANIANSFVEGIKSAIGRIVDAFKDGLNKARKVVEGKSPPIAGPFQNIDVWGYNVGMAWVQGVRNAISELSLENPMVSPIPAVAPSSALLGGQGGNRSGPLVTVEQMNVRDESDITEVARELGFRIANSTGFTSNG